MDHEIEAAEVIKSQEEIVVCRWLSNLKTSDITSCHEQLLNIHHSFSKLGVVRNVCISNEIKLDLILAQDVERNSKCNKWGNHDDCEGHDFVEYQEDDIDVVCKVLHKLQVVQLFEEMEDHLDWVDVSNVTIECNRPNVVLNWDVNHDWWECEVQHQIHELKVRPESKQVFFQTHTIQFSPR